MPLTRIPLSKRPIDTAIIIFFIINLFFITYIVDLEQLVIPDPNHFNYPLWPPAKLVDLVHWYGANFDPVLMARPAWWRATIWIDALFFGPFYVFAICAYIKGRNWIRFGSIIWASVRITGLLVCSFIVSAATAQDFNDYKALHFTSAHTAFPDTGRTNGHLYDSVLYMTTEHYSDSSVLLIIPKQLKTSKTVDLVFWFHGWRNNIDTAAEFYKLTQQFIKSRRNAVLVLAETAKNSPDSYGGKLEQPGMFRLLTDDVLQVLKKGGYVSDRTKAGNIVLAGHSGAFRVIAYILQNGQEPVQEVFLFDALYAEVDKYQNWLNQDWAHHFIHWYTNQGGGTDEVSEFMMKQLKSNSVHFLLTEEVGIKPKTIKDNYILFVHSLREHNVIINDPDDFQLLLENSFVLRPIK